MLLTQDRHDLHDVAVNTVIDAFLATNAAAIACADIIHSLIQIRLFRQLPESLKQRIVVSVSLYLPVFTNSVTVDSLQIGFRDVT